MKKQVKKFTRTRTVLNNATKSASFELLEAFSPRDTHQSFHIFLITYLKNLKTGQEDKLKKDYISIGEK